MQIECSTTSNNKKYAYCFSNTGYIYFFNLYSYRMESFSKVSESSIISIKHHPKKNLIAFISELGELTFMTP